MFMSMFMMLLLLLLLLRLLLLLLRLLLLLLRLLFRPGEKLPTLDAALLLFAALIRALPARTTGAISLFARRPPVTLASLDALCIAPFPLIKALRTVFPPFVLSYDLALNRLLFMIPINAEN